MPVMNEALILVENRVITALKRLPLTHLRETLPAVLS